MPIVFDIYSDMDGVAVDLTRGISEEFNVPYERVANSWHERNSASEAGEKKPSFLELFDLTEEQEAYLHSADFWAQLPMIEHYDVFFNELKQMGNLRFLTACDRPGHVIGKRMWVAENFPGTEVIPDKQKYKYANANSVLIDDKPEHVEGFNAQHRSLGILVPQPWNGGVFEGAKTYDAILGAVAEFVRS